MPWTDDFERDDLGADWADDGPLPEDYGEVRAASFLADGAWQCGEIVSEGLSVAAMGSIRRTTDAGTDQFIEAEVGNFFQGHDPSVPEYLQYVESNIFLLAQIVPGSNACVGLHANIGVASSPTSARLGRCYMEIISVDADGTTNYFGDGSVGPLTGWQSNPNYVVRLEVSAGGHVRGYFESDLLAEDDVTPTGGQHLGIGMQWQLTDYPLGSPPNPGASPHFNWVTGSDVVTGGGWHVGGLGWANPVAAARAAARALSSTSWTDDFERDDLGANWAEDGPLLGSGGARAASFLADGAYQAADALSEGIGVVAAASIRRTHDAGTDQFIEAEVGNFFQGHNPSVDERLQWVEGEVYLFAQLAPDSLAAIGAVAYIETGDGTGEAYMEFITIEADGSFGGFFGGGDVSPLTGWQSNPNYVIRLEVTAVGHCRAFFEGELLTEADMTPTGGHNVGIGMTWFLTNYIDPPETPPPNPGTSLRFEWVTGSEAGVAGRGGWSVG